MPAFRDAFFNMFITKNCKKAFKALGLVPIDAAGSLIALKYSYVPHQHPYY